MGEQGANKPIISKVQQLEQQYQTRKEKEGCKESNVIFLSRNAFCRKKMKEKAACTYFVQKTTNTGAKKSGNDLEKINHNQPSKGIRKRKKESRES